MLAYFLLTAGDSFRRKLIRIAGPSLARRRVTVEILNEIHDQVQHYMLVLLITNVLIGLATGDYLPRRDWNPLVSGASWRRCCI